MPEIKCSILLFTKIIPSYRLSIFKSLYEKFGIIACHSIERKEATWESCHDQMDFPHQLLSRYYYGKSVTNVVQNIFTPLIKFRPKIVISEFSIGYLSFWLLYLLRHVFRYKLVAWTHGVNNKDIVHPFKGLKSKIELHIFKKIDAVVLYSRQRKQIITEYMGYAEKFFVAQNTLDTDMMSYYCKKMGLLGKVQIKKELGFTNRYNLIYVGRLLKNKRIDLLLEGFELLSRSFDIGLHIIGDGPERMLVEDYKKKMQSVYTYGAIYDEETLGKYIFASDLMVSPGSTGLSIVNAFAYGIPYVTCRMTEYGPFHSPEIEYLHNHQNGLFCELSAESIAENISRLLKDGTVLKMMSDAALKTVQDECQIQNMLIGFEDLLNYLQE